MSARKAITRRRSIGKVGRSAPSRKKLLNLISVAARTADHGNLQPWRLIEIRGRARLELGEAMATVNDLKGRARANMIARPTRAPLLIAIVASRNMDRTGKIPIWEQDATASGVAHYLSLLLDEAGWGVMWRTGNLVRTEEVREFHRLAENEDLLGWLYVGNRTKRSKAKPKFPLEQPELKLTTFN